MQLQTVLGPGQIDPSRTCDEPAIAWRTLTRNMWAFYFGKNEFTIIADERNGCYHVNGSFADGCSVTMEHCTSFNEAQAWCAHELRKHGLLPEKH